MASVIFTLISSVLDHVTLVTCRKVEVFDSLFRFFPRHATGKCHSLLTETWPFLLPASLTSEFSITSAGGYKVSNQQDKYFHSYHGRSIQRFGFIRRMCVVLSCKPLQQTWCRHDVDTDLYDKLIYIRNAKCIFCTTIACLYCTQHSVLTIIQVPRLLQDTSVSGCRA